MATISSTTSSAHVAGRHIFGNALHLAGALVVVFGSVGFASFAARWILNGVPHAASSVHHAASSVPPAASAPQHANQGNDPIAVGMGATQSYHGMAITIDQLHIETKHDFLAAPAGQAFAIVTITIINTDPVQMASYNAANFQLDDHSGALHPEAVAALAAPLGIGTIAPHGRAQGDLAFLIAYPANLYQVDPAIRFLPTPNASLSLAWDMPVTPSIP